MKTSFTPFTIFIVLQQKEELHSYFFWYRSQELYLQDIRFIRGLISKHYARGRSNISRVLCKAWRWVHPSGKLKECAARDLLLRLEEKGFIELPLRLRPKNNLKQKPSDEIPVFLKEQLSGSAGEHTEQTIGLVSPRRQNGG